MIYGTRIRQARLLLGESQADFGKRIGVDQSKVSKAESDLLPLTEASLMAVAEHSGFPPKFFERPLPPAVDTYQFRARVRVKAADRHRVITSAEIVHESYDLMRRETTPPPVRIPQIHAPPAQAAEEMRSVLGLHPFAPVPNLSLPLERSGVVLLALPVPGNKQDAFSWWHRTGKRRYPVVAALAGAPGDRLRWDFAHELGHLVMHEGGGGSADAESEADAFAAALLTPLAALRSEMPAKPTLSSLYAMKVRWGVSVQSLIRRARELGAVDEHQYMSLFRQISARGERMNERSQVKREKPRAYRKMAEVLFGATPAAGLAGLAAWTQEYAQDVLDQFAAQHELPTRRATVSSQTGLADVVPLRASRSSNRRRPS